MPGNLRFSTNSGAASQTERFRITASGQLRLMEGNSVKMSVYNDGSQNFITSNSGQEIKVSCGNGDSNGIEFWDYTGGNKRCQIDGHGIKFNTDTAAANALDDYEEGSYVVTVTGSTSGSFALNPNSFRYTKIGRVVHISGRFYIVSGSPTGAECRISLPFTASSHIQAQDGSAYSYVTTYNAYSPNNDYQMANSVISGNAYSVLIWVVPNAAWKSVCPSSH